MRCSIGATPTIEAKIDAIAEQLAKAQLPDGYLNCWYIGREIENRWTNLRDNHELYCAGHMLEGRGRLFQGDRPPAACSTSWCATSTTSPQCSGAAMDRSVAIAAIRRSSSRWSSSIT